jgi:polysaccharide pyruvyl transferase WcaK-like protein
LPQTIGPFKGAIAKTIARVILQRARVIYSRDHAGLGETRDLLGSRNNNGKIRFCYDVGFVVDPMIPDGMNLDGLPERGNRASPVVGFNISGLLFMGGYTQKNMFGLRVDYRKLVHDIIEHLIHKNGATVLLVPHVFGTKMHAESDSAVCEPIYAELNKSIEQPYMARGNYDQARSSILSVFVIYLSALACMPVSAPSPQYPVVAIAYSNKFIGVLQTINAGSSVADPRELGSEDILAIIDRVYEQRASIQRQLERTMPTVKEAVLRLFSEIVSVA